MLQLFSYLLGFLFFFWDSSPHLFSLSFTLWFYFFLSDDFQSPITQLTSTFASDLSFSWKFCLLVIRQKAKVSQNVKTSNICSLDFFIFPREKAFTLLRIRFLTTAFLSILPKVGYGRADPELEWPYADHMSAHHFITTTNISFLSGSPGHVASFILCFI